MTDPDSPSSLRELGARELAGYRVLRSLASDRHAEVLLGHRMAGGVSQTVAIKTLPATDSGWDATLRACAALDRARGDHVVELVDLDADDESIRLIFERLPRGDVAELLRLRRVLDAGEAVTVLAPIAATLLRLHQAGVAHGGLSGATVLFRDDGSPTLIGFSRSELFEPGAPEVVLERVEAVGRDRTAARSLALEVLGRVGGDRAHAARELMADLDGCDDELVLALLASRLFEVAAARPVRFGADPEEPEVAPSNWRPIPVGQVGELGGDGGGGIGGGVGGVGLARGAGAPSSGWAAALGRVVPEPLLDRVLDTVGRSPAAPVVAGVVAEARHRWSSWTPARRLVALAVAAAVATVGIVTAVVPAGAVATHGAATAGPSAGAQAPGSSPSSAVASDPTLGGPTLDGPAVGDAPLDDPVMAAGSLVAARERCLSSLSLRCLAGVDEAGSSAAHDDEAAIRRAQQGGELPDPPVGAASGEPAALIERLGDSALVRLGGASGASMLLVKVDGAWRTRDLIDASVTPTPRPDQAGG